MGRDDPCTLVSILSLSFPKMYPKMSLDCELAGILAAINFPTLSQSELSLVAERAESHTEFRVILDGIKFYFPLVPGILEFLARNYRQDSEEVQEFCASVVLCSYVSWRIFVEFTRNFEHMPFLLYAIPFVLNSPHKEILIKVFIEAVMLYLTSVEVVRLDYIVPSIKQLFSRDQMCLASIQCVFGPMLNAVLPNPESELGREETMFLEFLQNATEYEAELLRESAHDVIAVIESHVRNMEMVPLHLFANIGSSIDINLKDSICAGFPESVLKMILESDVIIHAPKSVTSINLPEVKVDGISFGDDLIMSPSLRKIPDVPALSLERLDPNGILFESDMRKRLVFMAKACSWVDGSIDKILVAFRECARRNKERQFDCVYALSTIISALTLNQRQAEEYVDLVLEVGMFEKEFSSFDCEDERDVFHQARAEIVDSLVNSGFVGLPHLMRKLEDSLLLCSELAHRIYPNISSISTSVLTDPEFIEFVSTFCVRLHKVVGAVTNENDRTIMKSTRCCLLCLVRYALSIPEVVDVWFSLPLFNSALLYFLVESPVRQFVLDSYYGFLINRPVIHRAVTEGLLKHFNLIASKFEHEGFIQIGAELLQTLNNVFDQKFAVFRCMEDIYRKALSALDGISNDKESLLFLTEVMRVARRRELDKDQMEFVKHAIDKLKSSAGIEPIYSSLCYIMGRNNSTSTAFYYLKHPQVFKFLISACDNPSEYEFVLTELLALVQNSLYNCEQVFRSGVDKELLRVLMRMHKDESKDNDVVTLALRILEFVHTNFCAKDRVMRYMRLLASLPTGNVSIHQASYISALTHIFQIIANSPRTVVPCHTRVVVSQISSSLFKHTFQVNMWYFAEPEQTAEPRCICSIQNNKSKGFSIAFTSSQLIVTSNRKRESAIAFDIDMAPGKWTSIDVNFLISCDTTEVTVRIGHATSAPKPFSLKIFDDEFVSLVLGDGLVHRKPIGHIAAVCIFRGSDHHVTAWRGGGLTTAGNPELSMWFASRDNFVTPLTTFPAVFTDQVRSIGNFADVIVNDVPMPSLLLPFTQIDQKTVMGAAMNDINDLVVDVFVILFQIGVESQKVFYEQNCVDVISHILWNGKVDSITFSLYLHFCALVSCATLEDLKLALLQKIILNFGIWGRASNKAQISITTHWNKSIFAEFRNYATALFSIPGLLHTMSFDITERQSVKSLAGLILKLAKLRFTPDDLLCLVGFCVHCRDPERVKIGMNILTVIANECELSEEVKNSAECITLLHKCMRHKDEDTFIEMINVIITFHRRKLITAFPLKKHLDVVLLHLRVSQCSASTLDKLLAIAHNDNVPEIYPVCCAIATRLGQESIEKMVLEITANALTECSSKGLIWIVAVFLLADVSSSHKLVNLVCENDFSRLDEIVTAVILLCNSGRRDPGNHLVPLMSLAIATLSDHADKVATGRAYQLLLIAYRVLIYHSRVTRSQFVSSLFEGSPFKGPRRGQDVLSECIRQPSVLFRRITQMANKGNILQFGLRLDPEGRWKDSSLALQCLNLFEMAFDRRLLAYDLLLTGFLSRVKVNAASSHIQRINLKSFIHEVPEGLQQFILSSSNGKITLGKSQPQRSVLVMSAFDTFLESSPESRIVSFAKSVCSMNEIKQVTSRQAEFVSKSGVVVAYKGAQDRLTSEVLALRTQCHEEWNRTWKSLTVNHGPWASCNVSPNQLLPKRASLPPKSREWQHLPAKENQDEEKEEVL